MKKAHGGDSLKNQRLLYPGKTFRSKFGKWGNVYLFIILTVFVNKGAFAVRLRNQDGIGPFTCR